MKIIFFCGSMEEGRDGVGDYTRKLAGEMIRRGHKAAVIALNDQHTKIESDGVQMIEGVTLPVKRIPSTFKAADRYEIAATWVEHFNPDWLSLQFVPFAYHFRGLSFGIQSFLRKIGKGRNWQVMVHELWVGMDNKAPLKLSVWGWAQKQLIKSLLRNIKPALIHTHASLYMEWLKKMGFKPRYLPLFGNIENKISNHQLDHQSTIISFLVFGSIHPGAPIVQLANELKLYSDKHTIGVELKMVGRCGAEQAVWERECRKAGIQIDILGEQPAAVISSTMRNATFGISTTPPSLVEKSGAVAAMREHGLQILCVSRPWQARSIGNLKTLPGVVEYKEGVIEDFINHKDQQHPVKTFVQIVDQFEQDITATQANGKF